MSSNTLAEKNLSSIQVFCPAVPIAFLLFWCQEKRNPFHTKKEEKSLCSKRNPAPVR